MPAVLTNRGLVLARADGVVALRCNEAYGVNTAEQPSFAYDARGTIVLASSRGVSRTSDHGCSFTPSTGLPELPVGASARISAHAAKWLVSTESYEETSQVFESDDDGQSFHPLAKNAPLSVYEALVASSDGARIYASGQLYDKSSMQLQPLWSVSRDGGKSFTDQRLTKARIPLAVHPTQPDVVFAHEPDETMQTDRLVQSRDGGKSWKTLVEVPSIITAWESTRDGTVLWLGTERDGLYRADDGERFTRVLPEQVMAVRCLVLRGDALWACANMAPNTNGVWVSSDHGDRWEKVLGFDQVTEQVRCPAESARVCEAPWQDWQREQSTLVPTSASGRDAESEGESTGDSEDEAKSEPDADAPRREAEASGCRLAPTSEGTLTSGLLLLAGLLARTRRRRRLQT